MITAQDLLKQSANLRDPRDSTIRSIYYEHYIPLGVTWAYVAEQWSYSEVLTRSNFAVIAQDLKSRYPEDVAVVRWAETLGRWSEHVAVRVLDDEGDVTAAGEAAADWLNALEDDPIADGEHYKQLQHMMILEYLKDSEPFYRTTRAPKSADYRAAKAYRLLSERFGGLYLDDDDHVIYYDESDTPRYIENDHIYDLYRSLRWAYVFSPFVLRTAKTGKE